MFRDLEMESVERENKSRDQDKSQQEDKGTDPLAELIMQEGSKGLGLKEVREVSGSMEGWRQGRLS